MVSTRLKNMIVKMGIFPNFRGENKTCLKPPLGLPTTSLRRVPIDFLGLLASYKLELSCPVFLNQARPIPKLGFPSSWRIILNAFHLVKEWHNLGSLHSLLWEKRGKRLLRSAKGCRHFHPSVSSKISGVQHWKVQDSEPENGGKNGRLPANQKLPKQ